jgi:hypothetical protein
MENTVPAGNAPIKTAEGLDEIATRSRRLGQRHRTMLLLVDGRRSAEDVKRLAAQAGVSDTCYGELLEMGLIALPLPTLPISALAAAPPVPLTIDVPLPVDEDSLLPSALEEARDMMLRAVRAEAPVAGSLTLMRLRRARTRADLAALIEEVEARVRKPHRMLAATLLMRRVRELIGQAADSSLTAA